MSGFPVLLDLIITFLGELFDDKSQRTVLYKNDRKQEVEKPKNRSEYIESKRRIYNLKFAILFYIHIMYEEDDHLSFGELREVKKLIKEKEGFLSDDEKAEIKKVMKMKPSLFNLIDFAKENHITYRFVLQMIEHLKLSTENDERYQYVLKKLHRRFIIEKDNLH